jgi:hypothetical protein
VQNEVLAGIYAEVSVCAYWMENDEVVREGKKKQVVLEINGDAIVQPPEHLRELKK